jgi:hypothetical protein
MPITITEALAEIKTLNKRIDAKRQATLSYVARQDGLRDPMEKEGGSEKFIASERQSINDLCARIVALRRGIQHANDTHTITIAEKSRTISEWLTWRREVAPGEQSYLTALRSTVTAARQTAVKHGSQVVSPGAAAVPQDFVMNVNEQLLNAEIERLADTLGSLDGQLSLKNATVAIKE